MRSYDQEAIKRLRKEKGLTCRQFAKQIGTHSNNVLEWEHGRTRPSITTLEKIMHAFSVSEKIFFTDIKSCMHDKNTGNSRGRGLTLVRPEKDRDR